MMSRNKAAVAALLGAVVAAIGSASLAAPWDIAAAAVAATAGALSLVLFFSSRSARQH